MPNLNKINDCIDLALKLEYANATNDYTDILIKVEKNHKIFFKDTYSLICNASNKNIISILLHSGARCRKFLSVDINELRKLLEINNYKSNHFKTEENAKNVADYINASIVLQQLKM